MSPKSLPGIAEKSPPGDACLGGLRSGRHMCPSKAMTPYGIVKAIRGATGLPASEIQAVLVELNVIAHTELSLHGKFAIPQLAMLKLQYKPARPAGKKMLFGQERLVKAKPGKKVVTAFPLKALKDAL